MVVLFPCCLGFFFWLFLFLVLLFLRYLFLLLVFSGSYSIFSSSVHSHNNVIPSELQLRLDCFQQNHHPLGNFFNQFFPHFMGIQTVWSSTITIYTSYSISLSFSCFSRKRKSTDRFQRLTSTIQTAFKLLENLLVFILSVWSIFIVTYLYFDE